jgi:hypothetical protein
MNINEVNESELIAKYLSRAGIRVKDVLYYDQSFTFTGAGTEQVGNIDGYIPEHCFFFGNVIIDDTLGGVIVLANQNMHTFFFTTLLFNGIERESARVSMAVNYGMGLLGNGVYQGYKRLYGVGCNRVTAGRIGCGASTISATISLNGFMFVAL